MYKLAWRAWSGMISLALFAGSTAVVRADNAQAYGFEAAAQEITQLLWLADTATLCGWASEDDATRFKQFSIRFINSHLTGIHKAAINSMLEADNFLEQVRHAAEQSAESSCGSARWETGWVAYKAAADAHATEF